jgi:GTP-binding protein
MSGFVDEAQLHAKGGDGGAGAVSFRREAHVDRGGPDGGDGGHGGDVWLVSSHNEASLLGFRDHPHRRGGDGTHGSSKKKHGSRGSDLIVPVPVGTVIREREGAVIGDLAGVGDRWLAAAGGQGGMGNARFLSNKRRAPAFAEQGQRGQERWLALELKLMADVALVGLPNVGKSTLISTVSAAKPKIADYPFTTLEPHLGVVRVGERGPGATDGIEFVMADIPGLVEGAAEGRGLGHQFLRHVERARALLILLDLSQTRPAEPHEQLNILLSELGQYQPELLERPRLVVGSRADLSDDEFADLAELSISAVTGAGMPELLFRLAAMVKADRDAQEVPISSDVVIHRPAPEGVGVERRERGVFEITGDAAERAVRFSDLTDDGALLEAMNRLRRLGVDRALARAGAHDGDEVWVGPVSFTWFRDGQDGVLTTTDDVRPSKRARRDRKARS